MILEPALIVAVACIIDRLLGEAKCFHPLSGFGNLANQVESRLNQGSAKARKLKGVVALMLLLLPFMLGLSWLIYVLPVEIISHLIELVILYLAIGRQSLRQHAYAIMTPLLQKNMPLARKKIALMVSRDTSHMNQPQITTATIESVLENSNDALFGALFWFMVAGAPGVLMYRLANTLDAMWGYKNDRYLYFGWAAARFDDLLNWLPARLTVLSFSLLHGFSKVWPLAFQQGLQCSSKNGGPVMAAGACALNIKLGGSAQYEGKVINKPELGYGHAVTAIDIKRALTLVDKTLVLWIIGLIFLGLITEVV